LSVVVLLIADVMD